MESTVVSVMIWSLLLLHILPIVIAVVIVGDQFRGKRRINRRKIRGILLLIGVLSAAVTVMAVACLFRTRHLISLIGRFLTVSCTYQEMILLAQNLVISMLFAVALGCAMRMVITRDAGSALPGRKGGAFVLLLVTIGLISSLFGWKVGSSGIEHIEIREVCRKIVIEETKSSELEEVTQEVESSYVVVYNNGELPFQLEYAYLSDDPNSLNKVRIDELTIDVGESYQCFITWDKDFKIKPSGGSILYLSDGTGTVYDQVVVPALKKGEAYYRSENGWSVRENTSKNKKEEVARVQQPVFSRGSGFYDEAFHLSMEAEPGTTIYYTTDGSDPTSESQVYQEPIYVYNRSEEENVYRNITHTTYNWKNRKGVDPVPKCFIVRAIAENDAGMVSDVMTASYFVELEEYRSKKVISLISDPKNLFDPDYGIYVTGQEYDDWYEKQKVQEGYSFDGKLNGEAVEGMPMVNYRQSGMAWERPAEMEVFSDGKAEKEKIGIRIQGASSRIQSLKRFSLYARKEYGGSDTFSTSFLGGMNLHKVFLKNAPVDLFVSQLVGNRDVGVVSGEPVSVFLDGEFWYSTYIFSKYDDIYISQKYNLMKENVLVSVNGDGENEVSEVFSSVLKYLYAPIDDQEKLNGIEKVVDLQSYIDYMCINAYLGNWDVSDNHNYAMIMSAVEEDDSFGDSRLHWALNDTDAMFRQGFDFDLFALNRAKMIFPSLILLEESQEFCKRFVLTYMDLMNQNFSMRSFYDTIVMFPEIGSDSDLLEQFFWERPQYAVTQLKEEFGLSGSRQVVSLISNRSDAPIKLNTIIPDMSEGYWEGYYLTDYPVTVTAQRRGFDHWEVTADGETETYTKKTIEVPVQEGGVTINAVYK